MTTKEEVDLIIHTCEDCGGRGSTPHIYIAPPGKSGITGSTIETVWEICEACTGHGINLGDVEDFT